MLLLLYYQGGYMSFDLKHFPPHEGPIPPRMYQLVLPFIPICVVSILLIFVAIALLLGFEPMAGLMLGVVVAIIFIIIILSGLYKELHWKP